LGSVARSIVSSGAWKPIGDFGADRDSGSRHIEGIDMATKTEGGFDENALARLLGQRFGDCLYLRTPSDRSLLAQAITLGLVSEDGQLTGEGKRFWYRRI
jgi:hypothetical protein